MPGSSSIRLLTLIGNGIIAALLEEAGIMTLSDIWELDIKDDCIIRRLHDAAERMHNMEQYAGCSRHSRPGAYAHQWNLLLVRAYNRIIVVLSLIHI